MRFGSVCSGIEAASVAWHPLGWRAAWLSEIEPFPSAVLAHHYPEVPNLGDMTKLPERIASGEVEAPDVFCGGTPCQAFSVAGLRKSLDDARGNLSLVFCEIANVIDSVRLLRGEQPATIFWENVPGVLNTKDNAFGCFLAGLAGEELPLLPAGGKWTNAGVVLGPKRAVAWRVLDAQYFGVAQRRRRVFVVASARAGFDPAAVLFEFDGVRRDTAPSREARQGVAGGVEIGPGGGRLTDLNPTLDTRAKDGPIRNQLAGAVITMAHGQGGAEIARERRTTLTCNHEAPIAVIPATTHTLRGEGFDASEDGTGRWTPLVPVVAGALCKETFSGGMGGRPESAAAGHVLPVAFPANLSGTQCASAENIAPSMGAKNPTAVAHYVGGIDNENNGFHMDGVCGPLMKDSPTGGGRPLPAVAYTTKLHNTQSNQAGKVYEEYSTSLDRSSPPPALLTSMQVRRLTPVECERLQGFPDGYTQIPWRKKPATDCPDGPRYKALGNSWAVPNVRWIGQRIVAHLAAIESSS